MAEEETQTESFGGLNGIYGDLFNRSAPFVGEIILDFAAVDNLLTELLYALQPLADKRAVVLKIEQQFSVRVGSAEAAFNQLPELSTLREEANKVFSELKGSVLIRTFLAHGVIDLSRSNKDLLVFRKHNSPKKARPGTTDYMEVWLSDLPSMSDHCRKACTGYLKLHNGALGLL